MARWHERVKAEAMASEQIRKNKSEKLEAYFDATTDGATDLFVGAEKKKNKLGHKRKRPESYLSLTFFFDYFCPTKRLNSYFLFERRKKYDFISYLCYSYL